MLKISNIYMIANNNSMILNNYDNILGNKLKLFYSAL